MEPKNCIKEWNAKWLLAGSLYMFLFSSWSGRPLNNLGFELWL